jgi:predicted RND superfamily exporter protein
VAGQIESRSIALAVIFVVMSAMFLSFRIGFLAILPNLLPICIFFGVMALPLVPNSRSEEIDKCRTMDSNPPSA